MQSIELLNDETLEMVSSRVRKAIKPREISIIHFINKNAIANIMCIHVHTISTGKEIVFANRIKMEHFSSSKAYVIEKFTEKVVS